MNTIINRLANLIFKLRLITDSGMEEVQKNDRNTISFLILCLIPMAILLTFSSINFFSYKPFMFISYLLLALIILIGTAAYLRSSKLYEKTGYGIKMHRFNLWRKDYDALKFNSKDIENIQRLLRGLKVESKIVNRNLVKNGSSASHYFLFSLMHVFVKEGILELRRDKRKSFFNLLEDSFSMNGENVKRSTLESSYSRWNAEMKDPEIEVAEHKNLQDFFNLK